MMIYELCKVHSLPISIDEAWAFFSTAGNLEKITPPDLSFHILTQLKDAPIYSGMIINYIVRPLFGIPLRWTTEITNVNAPFTFTDRQVKGPYALWEHTHTFESVPGGVKMTDVVRYALPLYFLGELAHRMVVKKKLNDIFEYREKTLNNLFGSMENI